MLRNGVGGLVLPVIDALVRSPWRFFSSLRLALRTAGKTDHRVLHHLAYFAEACRVRRWLYQFQAQHVHAHFGTNSAEVAMLARALGAPPYSFTVHGPDEFLQPLALREKISHSAAVVAISSFGASQLYLRASHKDWHKIAVVHCGLERSFYDTEDIAAAHPRRFLCVGRLSEAKGQLLLIEAAARLRSKGIQFHLVLAGDGPMRVEIESLIHHHGLDEHVRITGWISSDEVRREILASRGPGTAQFRGRLASGHHGSDGPETPGARDLRRRDP